MGRICKEKDCEAVEGVGHSELCVRNHAETVNPDMAVIRKAIERYCEEVADPRKYCMMIVNAVDMMEWLLDYDSTEYTEARMDR